MGRLCSTSKGKTGFVLTPLVVALSLSMCFQGAFAKTIEYQGVWVPDDFMPSNPPFLEGKIIEKDNSGNVTSSTDFSRLENWDGSVINPYGFITGQDWSFLGLTYEQIIQQMPQMEGKIDPVTLIAPHGLYLTSQGIQGAAGTTTTVTIPDTFNGKKQTNAVAIVMPVTEVSGGGYYGGSVIQSPGTYHIDVPVVSVGFG